MLVAVMLLALAIAAAPLDTDRAALLHVLSSDNRADACSATELNTAVAQADISTLGTVAGRRVILAAIDGSCLCGNVNCPYLALRLDPAGPQLIYSSYAFAVTRVAGQPLPELRARSHDSALISMEDLSAYRNGRYVALGSWRVNEETGARKPLTVPLHFAPGSSSAAVHGTVGPEWEDAYAFDAAPGQHLTVSGIHSARSLELSLQTDGAVPRSLEPGRPSPLSVGGHYVLRVESDDEHAAYTLTVTIGP